MSDEFVDQLEELIGKHREKQAAAKQQEANDARFSKIEEGIGGLGALIEEKFPSPAAADNSESSAAEKGEEKPSGRQADPPPAPEPELNVEKIGQFTVPRIYQGDDEPEIVQYVDADTGETMTRKGRKKNFPTKMDVQIVMPEPENRPQEPNEEQTA